MGGLALNCPTARLGSDDYHRLAKRLAREAAAEFGVRTHVVRAYRNKPDFGDLDLVVERTGGLAGELDVPGIGKRTGPVPDSEVIQRLKQFATRYHSRDARRERNAPVFSFEHRDSAAQEVGFQVDMILALPDDFDTTCDYFAYNDLGNLAGRLAHELGCKYGFKGLHMSVVDGTRHIQTLCLGKDTRTIHALLGLDHDRFLAGFDAMEEVFDFVMASDLFHPELYKLENAGYRERARDRKRVNYSAFLDRCAELEPAPYDPVSNDKAMARLERFFPGTAGRVAAAHEEDARRRELSQWFNGHSLGQWTGAAGEDLGKLIKQLREEAGGDGGLARWGQERVRGRAMEIVSQPEAPGRRGPGVG